MFCELFGRPRGTYGRLCRNEICAAVRRNSSELITTTSLLFPREVQARKLLNLGDKLVGSSYELLIRKRFIRQQNSGLYHLLPLGYRVLEKLVGLVDKHLQAIGGRKMAMPILTAQSLWNKTGRWEGLSREMFKVDDRAKKTYCLGPTHEESVTSLVQEMLSSRRELPLRLYQIERKFRDEARPRFGLMRAREFWMKDMYTFDETEEKALETYEAVMECYERILRALDLQYVKAEADTGDIGGSLSHEFIIPNSSGEGRVTHCSQCGFCTSRIPPENSDVNVDCPHSRNSCAIEHFHGIEVAHAFYLGTKYSEPFNLTIKEGTKERPVPMGCYGIGVSRVLATVVEVGFKDGCLNWPQLVAPYLFCIVSSCKDTSHPSYQQTVEVYNKLQEAFPGEVIFDDRWHLQFGGKLSDLKTCGFPFLIILGNKVADGYLEIETPQRDENMVVHISEFINTLKSMVKI